VAVQAGDLPIRTGMTANADLITSERNGVLLVANRAITADRSAGKFYVHRLRGDTVEEVEVTIGLRDSNYTEITSGLDKGDELVLDYAKDQFAFGPQQSSYR
jgi:macrolide-specific efflux system membrane fusion protein